MGRGTSGLAAIVLGCLALTVSAYGGGGDAEPAAAAAAPASEGPAAGATEAADRGVPPAALAAQAGVPAAPVVDPADDPDGEGFEPLEPAEVVAAADGSAEIRIPDGALPEGMTAADLSITALVAEDVVSTPDGSGEIVAYRLEPEGVQFLRPLTIAVRLPLDPPAAERDTMSTPLMLLVSRGVADDANPIVPVSNTRVETDAAAGTLTVLGEVLHFSDVAVDREGLFVAQVAPARAEVGHEQSFTWTVTVTTQVRRYTNRLESLGRPEQRTVTPLEVEHSVGEGTTFRVNAFRPPHLATFGVALQPAETPDLRAASVRAEAAYTHSVSFTCSTEGDDTVIMVGAMHVDYVHQIRSAVQGAGARGRVERENKGAWVAAPFSQIHCLPPFRRLGPPYVIICPNGAVLSGTQDADAETGEPLTDAAGNPIDVDTGQPAVCPGGD